MAQNDGFDCVKDFEDTLALTAVMPRLPQHTPGFLLSRGAATQAERAAPSALPATRYSLPATSAAFTIVEVMMAAVILVVGFMGMIQAITIGSEMLATAQRQNLAAQILDHEIGKLRLNSWSSISALTDTSAATYSSDLTAINNSITSSGVSFQLERDVTDLTTDLREVTLTVTWTKSGTTTDATAATGSWLQGLSFSGAAPIARIYTRKSTAYFGKYGLNLNVQRS